MDPGNGAGKVPSGQPDPVSLSQPRHPFVETYDPTLAQPSRDAQSHQVESGFTAHRRDVAQIHCKGLLSELPGSEPLAAKMHSLEQEIRREQPEFPGSCGSNHCGVVSDSLLQGGRSAAEALTKELDDFVLRRSRHCSRAHGWN